MSAQVLIVGAGFYGATTARALTDRGISCLVLEQLPVVGGHARTSWNTAVGCYVHDCGPHIFHTNDETVRRFVNRFAAFNGFVNRPKVRYRSHLYSFPINLMTLHQVFGVMGTVEAKRVLALEQIPNAAPANMEEFCLASIGRELYERFIEGYTEKQWGRHPRELPASIVKRLPVRTTYDDRYFTDTFQGVPIGGYTRLIENMLDGIEVRCGVDFMAQRDDWLKQYRRVIYTGAIDEFFGYEFGPLAYRTLDFQSELIDVPDFQGNAVINYTARDVPYTRITEHKHFEGVDSPCTYVTREFSRAWVRGSERFYPIEEPESRARLEGYRAIAAHRHPGVTFGGRLGQFKYMDMHQVVRAALDDSILIAPEDLT